ncbi:MAG: MFS transporter [Desulfobacterales bacterium]|jgi:MFS family permease|nr:MFS transporter [Desulfobacteraceae bacterium]MBT7085931.1 MFS transporter [Desulfobacterales bacterium]MBT7696897.1 MFS transporter [Desulfobacterales bacterium]
MAEHEQKPIFYGWINVTILFFIYMFATGMVFYPYSVIFPVMIEDMGWARGPASAAFTLNFILTGLLGPVLAVVIAKFGTKKTIIAGLICWLLCLLMLGTITNTLFMWIFCWGILGGVGMSFSGAIPMQANVMTWFVKRRATAIGIVMTGAAAGGFIAQPAYTWLITKSGWRAGWLAAAFFVVLSLIIAAFLKSKPEDMGQYPDGIDPDADKVTTEEKHKTSNIHRTDVNWPLKEVFKTMAAWCLVGYVLGFIMAFFLITSHGVLHFTDLGLTRMQAASVMGAVILGAGVARFPMGALGDRIEPRWIISGAMFLMTISLIGLWKAPGIEILMIASPCFGFSYGTLIVMQPALIGNYYGSESFPKINGAMSPFIVGITAVVPIAAGIIADRTGSYDLAFMIICTIVFLSFLCSLMLKPPVQTFDIEETSEETGV